MDETHDDGKHQYLAEEAARRRRLWLFSNLVILVGLPFLLIGAEHLTGFSGGDPWPVLPLFLVMIWLLLQVHKRITCPSCGKPMTKLSADSCPFCSLDFYTGRHRTPPAQLHQSSDCNQGGR